MSALHPEAERLIASFDDAGVPPFEEMTVPQARAAAQGFLQLQGDLTEVSDIAEITIPGPGGPIPARVITPHGDGPFPVIVYFHGGGWVVGDSGLVEAPLRTLSACAKSVIVAVDYRLAPEHRSPAALDDCYAATAWVSSNCGQLNGDPNRLVVAGDSAGGNLAAGVALSCRDNLGPSIAAQVLIYPVVDFDFTTASYTENATGNFLTRASMQWFWAHYLGASELSDSPYAAPNRIEDLSGLPPTFIATAECDVLRDEGNSYAARLGAAGVPTTTREYEGMIHGFFWALGALPSVRAINDDIAGFLRDSQR